MQQILATKREGTEGYVEAGIYVNINHVKFMKPI
jgi:hypothetical protein